MTKTEIELFMFDFYLMITNNPDITDYDISNDLGITQSKARSLRVRNHLIYPKTIDWKEKLLKSLNNASYDKNTDRISINILDPNVLCEIEHFLEIHSGGFNENQLKQSVLTIKPGYMVELLLHIEPENEKKEIIKK